MIVHHTSYLDTDVLSGVTQKEKVYITNYLKHLMSIPSCHYSVSN